MKNDRFLKIFFAIALCIMCFVLFPTKANAASVDDLTFTLNSDGYAVSGCVKDATGMLEIPATYSGMPVNAISDGAFLNCSKLTNIVIPDSVTSIAEGAFSGCSSLESLTTPFVIFYVVECHEDVENYIFYPLGYIFGSNSYTGGIATSQQYLDVSDPEYDNRYFLKTFYIPASLKSVTVLGGSVDRAFYNCSNLTSITLSNNISGVSGLTFYNCKNLTDIRISADNTNFYFDSNGFLYDISKNRLIFADKTLSGSITIPDGVTQIDSGAFSSCNKLTNIVLPDSVTSIGKGAFTGCSSLKGITTPFVGFDTYFDPYLGHEKCYYQFGYLFGTDPFSNSIEVKQSYEETGSLSWRSSTYYIPASLTSVTVTGDVMDYAFYNCSNLSTIILSDKVTSIGKYAFYNCNNLTDITIPSSVTSIDWCAFNNCDNLAGIWVSENNLEYSNDVNGVLFSKDKSTLICAPGGISGNYIIPDGVSRICYSAFYGCKGLKSIVIPESITTIDDSAFYGCSDLADVYYSGTESQWEQINFSWNNSSLTSATIHFEDVGSTMPPSEPVNDPTIAATNATSNPTTTPTKPTTAPTKPTTAPTKPTTAPTKPTNAPTAATTKPTTPTAKPTQKPTAATTKPATPSTQPPVQLTQPDTLPTEQPAAPDIEATEETTVQVAEPTNTIENTPSTTNNKNGSIPWWWLLIVSVICIGSSAVVSIIILKKKK